MDALSKAAPPLKDFFNGITFLLPSRSRCLLGALWHLVQQFLWGSCWLPTLRGVVLSLARGAAVSPREKRVVSSHYSGRLVPCSFESGCGGQAN